MITLAKALKLKNIQVKKVNDILDKVKKHNSHNEENKPVYDVKDLLKDYSREVNRLIVIKETIVKATVPIQSAIVKMAELKTFAKMFKSLPTSAGKIQGYNVAVVMVSQISETEKDKWIEDIEGQINSLQDHIDKHNATTEVDL